MSDWQVYMAVTNSLIMGGVWVTLLYLVLKKG